MELTKSQMINRIAELAQENAELKAENDRLREENYGLNQELLGYKKGVQASEIIELKQTLQEIKTIAEENKDTVQYGGICRSILMEITKAEEE